MIKEQMSKASCFDTHSSLLLQLLLSQGGWGPVPRIAGNLGIYSHSLCLQQFAVLLNSHLLTC